MLKSPFPYGVGLLTILSIALAGCASTTQSQSQTQDLGPGAAGKGNLEVAQLQSGGRKRTYLVGLPGEYSSAKRWPLVFVLHGSLQNGQVAAQISRFDEFAYRNGIIVVFPDSAGATFDWRGISDVEFFTAMIDSLEASYSVDASRIYVTGGSSGGFMVFKLACDLADRIAAIAPVVAIMPVSLSESCHPTRPVPVLEINGTSDRHMPYDGGIKLVGGAIGTHLLSAQSSAHWWAQLDGCAEAPARDSLPPKTKDGLETRREMYSACRNGTEVALYTVVGGGHNWPGGEHLPRIFAGRMSLDLDANEVIWQFFQVHPLPETH